MPVHLMLRQDPLSKQNILVACITHGGVTELPGGDSVIREGDTVVVVTTRNDIIYKLDDIFEA